MLFYSIVLCKCSLVQNQLPQPSNKLISGILLEAHNEMSCWCHLLLPWTFKHSWSGSSHPLHAPLKTKFSKTWSFPRRYRPEVFTNWFQAAITGPGELALPQLLHAHPGISHRWLSSTVHHFWGAGKGMIITTSNWILGAPLVKPSISHYAVNLNH